MDTQQGEPKRREPHQGRKDCERGRHDWRYVGLSEHHEDVYRCECCDILDTD